MKFNPGLSTAWNFPRRSTTQAVCCGTTFTDCVAKITTATTKTIITIMKPESA